MLKLSYKYWHVLFAGPQDPRPQEPRPRTPRPQKYVNNFHHATFYIKVLVAKFQNICYFLFHRLLRLCSHSVAVADKENILPDLVRGVRVAYRSSITYPQLDGGAGRKGGRKRKQRIYVSQPESSAAKKPSSGSPFTEIWHNNNPLVLKKVNTVPAEKNRCGYCGGEFPRGILACRPYDIVLSHSERWQYPNKQRSGPNDPKFLPSPAGRFTVRFYCVKHECVFKRFPYFRKELLEIPDELELWPSHKKLLNEQLNVNI